MIATEFCFIYSSVKLCLIFRQVILMEKEKINYEKDYVNKPWGHYCDVADNKGKWNLKVIFVEKGKRLSLQRHQLRSELWMVADGKIEAIVGEDKETLSAKETIYIEKGKIHRATALEDSTVVELSFGLHDENDIERLEDDHGRV